MQSSALFNKFFHLFSANAQIPILSSQTKGVSPRNSAQELDGTPAGACGAIGKFEGYAEDEAEKCAEAAL